MIDEEAGEIFSPIPEARQKEVANRVKFLKLKGFGAWFEAFESEVRQGLIPEISTNEGDLFAIVFDDLTKLEPTQPTTRTETPTMNAILADLTQVIGPEIERQINEFVSLDEFIETIKNLQGLFYTNYNLVAAK